MHVNIIPRDRIEQTSSPDLRHARAIVELELDRTRDPEDRRALAAEALRYTRELGHRAMANYAV